MSFDQNDKPENIMNDPGAAYGKPVASYGNLKTYRSQEEMEFARAREAASSSYTQRFRMLMKLIKTSVMIKNAKIISNPSIPKNNG